MERAGLAVARFALAIAPHARTFWIACGPGNNGGDGYEAAWNLKLWGKEPIVTCINGGNLLPRDASISRQKAIDVGVAFSESIPEQYDLCIDALFGIGQLRPFDEACSRWVARINSRNATVLSIDIPSGLNSDTGVAAQNCVNADFTLSLLTLKPGLLTADGRQVCGDIWFNSLDCDVSTHASACINPAPQRRERAHNSHKGNYGDVGIVGGNTGMVGAALLAASAALQGGAGRVFVALLASSALDIDVVQPELMFRDLASLKMESMAVVAGCGGGSAIHAHLAHVLAHAKHLVLDADALNAVARDSALQKLLCARANNTTVLTPHPLEAARMMQVSSQDIQSDRLHFAKLLAERFACTVVLKGSGTIVATPNALPCINPTGSARLATAGTGDVLAGLIGARMASGLDAFQAACDSVYHHGRCADLYFTQTSLSAQRLVQTL